ncbi:MAG: zinc-ribbon domain-containing protein [Clostridiales bacterium]|nr:zinc-ribbon domain-containing protein [Clostridiales bacterium]
MSFCRNCGTELVEEALFCPNCGTAVNVQEAAPVNEVIDTVPEKSPSKGAGIVGIVFSALSFALSWMGIAFGFYGVFTIAFAIVGLIFSGKAKRSQPQGGSVHKMGKIGKTFGILGLIFSIIFMIVGIIALFGLIFSEFNY